MNKLQISPEAYNDLEEIRKYIQVELENKIAANNTVKSILKKIKSLPNQPYLGTPLSAHIEMDTNIRFLVTNSYLTFYVVENGNINVLRVLYGRRDYLKILFRNEILGN